MRHLIIYALTTSATFLAFSNSVNAKECPPLKVDEITVNDPNREILLRTNTASAIQNIPQSNGRRAVVNDGEKLLIYNDFDPKNQSGICFYPVEINETNNPSNKNQTVLSYKPYWIPEYGIKDYQGLISKSQIISDSTNVDEASKIKRVNWHVILVFTLFIFGSLFGYFTLVGMFWLIKKNRNTIHELRMIEVKIEGRIFYNIRKMRELEESLEREKKTIKQLIKNNAKLHTTAIDKPQSLSPSDFLDQTTEQDQNLIQIQQTIQHLKAELNTLKKVVTNFTPIPSNTYQPLLNTTNNILRLPLSKIIDLYRECPEILEAYAQRVTIDKKHFSLDDNTTTDQSLSFEANPNGNFWVIQLETQGSFLFPRPNDTRRMNRLSMLDQIFQLNGNTNETETEFDVVLPAKLLVTRLQTNWQLKKKGELSYAQIPLNYQWQKELTSIRQQQEIIVKKTENLVEKNKKLESDLVQKSINKEFYDFRKDILFELAKLRKTIRIQQEKIKCLLAHRESNKVQSLLTDLASTGDLFLENDPFYSEVILKFNAGASSWFSSLVKQGTFGKVKMTKNSVLGQIDMGGKVTQLELDEQGTLLIYQAGEKLWVIPDQSQSNWKSAVTDYLFNSNGQILARLILARPAEVESVGNHLWQLVEKGEFHS